MNKKDIEIKHQYLRDLKEQLANGTISKEELHRFVLNELKTMEIEEDYENILNRFFKRNKS